MPYACSLHLYLRLIFVSLSSLCRLSVSRSLSLSFSVSPYLCLSVSLRLSPSLRLSVSLSLPLSISISISIAIAIPTSIDPCACPVTIPRCARACTPASTSEAIQSWVLRSIRSYQERALLTDVWHTWVARAHFKEVERALELQVAEDSTSALRSSARGGCAAPRCSSHFRLAGLHRAAAAMLFCVPGRKRRQPPQRCASLLTRSNDQDWVSVPMRCNICASGSRYSSKRAPGLPRVAPRTPARTCAPSWSATRGRRRPLHSLRCFRHLSELCRLRRAAGCFGATSQRRQI